MKYIQRLIDRSRNITQNVEFSETTGISNDEIIGYLNDAQDRMQSRISTSHADLFQVEALIDVSNNQEAVDIPDDAFLGNRVDNVEYSPTGNERNYYKIKQGRLSERLMGNINGSPSFYIRRSGQILLQPKVQGSGKIRMTYQKKLPRLELRSGTVNAVTLDTATNTITSLTLDPSVLIDKTTLEQDEYFTIVDKDGVVKMRRIPITSVDETTGIMTLPSFTYEDGETIEVGDYALRGRESSTHSQLPATCERYLVEYTNWKVLKRDSSQDSLEESQELVSMGQEIIEALSYPDGDPDFVTVLDPSYIDVEEYY